MAAEDWIGDFYDYDEPYGGYDSQYDDVTNVQEEWDAYHRCKGKPVLRTNGKTGSKFIGCSMFPKCRHTIPWRGEMPE